MLTSWIWPKSRMLVLVLIPLLAFVSCGEDDPVAPVDDPACHLSDDALDFGTVAVGGSRDLSCTIRNTGGGTLTGEVTESCGHYVIVSGGGAFSLGAGDSVVVTVRFEPAEEGTHTCLVATGVASCGGISCAGDAQYAWEAIYTSGYHFWKDIWGSSANDIWVVGGEMRHYTGSSWSEVTNPSAKSLYGVWGSGPNNVYAVGHDYFTSKGVILHYNGTSWSIILDELSVGFLGVWGSGPNDIYAVGIGGSAYHYNGTTWETVFLGGVVTHAVWGTASNDVFVVGDTGRIEHFNGSTWETQVSGTSYALIGIWGASSSDVFVSSMYQILSYNSPSWELMQITGSSPRMEDIWGTSPTNVYSAGVGGRIMHFDGASWKDMISPTTEPIMGIWGTSSSNIYAVGDGGSILRYTGN